MPPDQIEQAAEDIYRAGIHVSNLGVSIRVAAMGRERSKGLSADYPGVVQLTWEELLAFMWDRLHRYRRQKTQVNQWDEQGTTIKHLADTSADGKMFIERALRLMEVRHNRATL